MAVALNNVEAQTLLTPEQSVATALKSNYNILLKQNDSAVYALDNKYANSAFLPSLNASASTLFNNNNTRQTLADGTQKSQTGINSNNIQSSLNMNWVLFDGLKMFATRDKLKAYTELGSLELKQELEDVISQTLIAYYSIVAEKQQLRAIEEQMALNRELVAQAEKKLNVGLAAKPELLTARTDLNAQQAARLSQINKIDILKNELNKLMAVPAAGDYEVIDTIPINKDLNLDEIYAAAIKNNPSINIAKKNIEISKFVLKEKKADRFPVLSANAAYNFTRNKNQLAINNFTPLLNRNYGFNYGLTATIPLFNKFNVKRQIEQAELDINYAGIVLQQQVLSTDININSAYKNYVLSLSTLALEEENILMAKENVSIAAERNRLGLSTILDLRETQKTLELAFTRLIRARYNSKAAEIELKKLAGILILK
ncbi:MAG: TolC family protein [Bacteroidetes bacterium]|nr:TolC family protein [Bacteroidota bacterium]